MTLHLVDHGQPLILEGNLGRYLIGALPKPLATPRASRKFGARSDADSKRIGAPTSRAGSPQQASNNFSRASAGNATARSNSSLRRSRLSSMAEGLTDTDGRFEQTRIVLITRLTDVFRALGARARATTPETHTETRTEPLRTETRARSPPQMARGRSPRARARDGVGTWRSAEPTRRRRRRRISRRRARDDRRRRCGENRGETAEAHGGGGAPRIRRDGGAAETRGRVEAR